MKKNRKKLSDRKKKWIERTVSNGRNYKSVLYNRFFVVIISALLQAAVYGVLIWSVAYHSTIGFAVQICAWAISINIVIHIIL